MKAETRGWIASAILAPICLVVLSWTLVIFHTNRRKWQSKDLIISTLITQGIVKQIATFLYALIVLLKPIEYFDTHCGCVKWLITSIDIFQAATIGTLIVTRLLAVRFPSRFRAISKRTHLYYHMITLGILSSCIGIASILAEKSHEDNTAQSDDIKYCTYLPYELNPKYAILSISLNALVDLATIVALVWTIYAFCRNKRLASALAKNGSNPSTIPRGNTQRHGLMTSSSDLSQLSDASLRSLQNAGDRYQNRNTRNDYSSSRETNFGQYLGSNNGKMQRPIVRGMLDSRNLVPTFQNGDSFYGDASIGKSSGDTLKSSKLIHNYHQLLNGSKASSPAANCDEMYAPTRVNRWASESSYLSTSTSSTNSRTPCLVRQPIREENLGIATTVAIFALCFICNHLPFLLITITGTFWPSVLPLWPLNAYLLWAGLLQDCLLPIALAGVDRNFKMWLRQIYARQHRTPLAKHQGLDGKFRVFNTPLQSMQPMQLIHNEPIKFPITNGSLFSSVDGRLPIIHNYRRGPGQRTNGLLSTHCINSGLPGALRRVAFTPRTHVEERKQRMDEANYRLHVTGNFPSDNANSAEAGSSFEDTERRTIQEIFRANLRNSMRMQDFRLSNMDLEPFRSDTLDRSEFDDSNEFESEPIYATLSSRSCCSATTAANDDFEFYQNDSHEITDAVNCTVLVNQFAGISAQSCGMHGRESVLATLDQSNLAGMVEGERQIAETQHESHVSIESNSLESEALQDEFPKHDTGVIERENKPFLLQENQITLDNENQKIDQCRLRLHDHHISVLDRTPSHHPPLIREENETEESMVLESFNNLKHLHDLRRTNELENVTIQKFKDDSIFTDTMSESVSVSSLEFSTDDTLQDTSSSAQDITKLNAPFRLYDADVPVRKSKRRLYKKTPLNRRYLEPQSTKRLNTPPTNRRLMKPKRVEKTPPLCRRSLEAARAAPPPSPGLRREFPSRRTRTKKMLPVLSVDSLSAALNDAGVSYLDNGDLWRHGRQEMGGSVPDFKKIFVSDFI